MVVTGTLIGVVYGAYTGGCHGANWGGRIVNNYPETIGGAVVGSMLVGSAAYLLTSTISSIADSILYLV